MSDNMIMTVPEPSLHEILPDIRRDITKQDYQELILKVSNEIAREFIKNEENLSAGALHTDADIADITRQIGLKTTGIVSEKTCEGLVKKTVGGAGY